MNVVFTINKEGKKPVSNLVKMEIVLNIIGVILVTANLVSGNLPAQTKLILYIISYILIGHEIIFVAFKNLFRGVVMPNLL